jgi:dipeptidyl aminopeptidase/acylaminoacyl peptidase
VFAPENSPSPVPLMEARAGFQTQVGPSKGYDPFLSDGPPDPPPPGIQLVRYPSPAGQLAAYITADPGDGRRHPAVVWAHGGFGGTSADNLTEDGDAFPFVQAGLVVMAPSWRGENDNPGRYEMFYGEVDDALAAIDYVSKLPYVDPNRVYMAGHSTGGTLTLLAAESTTKLRAAFSMGGAPDLFTVLRPFGIGYGNTPFNWTDKKERRLRSAIDYVGHLKTPTWYFEGSEETSYCADARKMETLAKKFGTPFTVNIIQNGDHFTVVWPTAELIAQKILADTGPQCNITISQFEAQNKHDEYNEDFD